MASSSSIPRFTAALLLAALLLVGRSTIATHAYEHDLAEDAHECEFCESVHVNGKDVIPESVESTILVRADTSLQPPGPVFAHPILPLAQARGPPRTSAEQLDDF